MHVAAAAWQKLCRNRSSTRSDVKYSFTEKCDSRISRTVRFSSSSVVLVEYRMSSCGTSTIVIRLEHSLTISRGSGILCCSSNPGCLLGLTARKSTASSIRSGLSDQVKTCKIRIDLSRYLSGIWSRIRAYVSSSVGGRLPSAFLSKR